MRDGDILTFHTKGGVALHLELVVSEEARKMGLMFRNELPRGTGMFFLYTDEPQRRSMWMKNMKIPLDIVWLDGMMRILTIRKDVQPCSSKESCVKISSFYKAQHAIELPAGEADRIGLTIGEKLVLKKRKSTVT